MSNQGGLFEVDRYGAPVEESYVLAAEYDGTTGFNVGSDTSRESEQQGRASGSAARLQQRVLEALFNEPTGLTSDACEAVLDGRHQSVSAALRNLELAGQVFTLVEKRKTRSNRAAHPYVHARWRERYTSDEVRAPTPRRASSQPESDNAS